MPGTELVLWLQSNGWIAQWWTALAFSATEATIIWLVYPLISFRSFLLEMRRRHINGAKLALALDRFIQAEDDAAQYERNHGR